MLRSTCNLFFVFKYSHVPCTKSWRANFELKRGMLVRVPAGTEFFNPNPERCWPEPKSYVLPWGQEIDVSFVNMSDWDNRFTSHNKTWGPFTQETIDQQVWYVAVEPHKHLPEHHKPELMLAGQAVQLLLPYETRESLRSEEGLKQGLTGNQCFLFDKETKALSLAPTVEEIRDVLTDA